LRQSTALATTILNIGCNFSFSLENMSKGSQSSEAGVKVGVYAGPGMAFKPGAEELLSSGFERHPKTLLCTKSDSSGNRLRFAR
jgi:hypothetical protein